jgi:hypothetical protein
MTNIDHDRRARTAGRRRVDPVWCCLRRPAQLVADTLDERGGSFESQAYVRAKRLET